MAAVPVNMMHGLPIPTPMQVMPCSSMLSIPISTMSYNTSNTLTSNDFSPQMQMQDSSTMVNPNHVGNPVASSPSRSLSSASPPASSMMNGSTMMASASSPLPEENPEYLKELQAEKDTLELSSSVNGSSSEIPTGENNENNENQNKTNHALKLLEQEIARVQSGRSGGSACSSGYREPIKYVDVYRERPIRLTVRVLVPVREHPKFNFVGKLLGPKGNSMKRLQEETMTKMAVLGRGSMRDKQKEEELRASNDPKYQHLQEELHVEITAFAPPAEAHARIAYALTEVRKYLIPDSNDEIRQEQMREMEILAANGDNINAAAAAAAAAAAVSGQADPTKRVAVPVSAGQAVAASAAALNFAPNLAMMHPAFRPNLALAAATPQSIQSQAAAAAAMLRGISPASAPTAATGVPAISAATAAAAAAAMRSQNGQLVAAATSPYIAAAPMIRKLVTPPSVVQAVTSVSQPGQPSQQQKLYAEEMMLEAAAVSQAPSDVSREDGSEGEAWQGLKAPTAHHDQRSKFRQQAAPYIRPN